MKYLIHTLVVVVALSLDSLKAVELPRGIPDAVDGNMLVATIADRHELKDNYPKLNRSELEEIDGYSVVQKKSISDFVLIVEAVKIIKELAVEGGPLGMCFSPRHYLSYMSEYGEVRLEVCFECSRVRIDMGGWGKTLSVNKSGARKLNEFYEKIGVVVPKMYQKN
ncbi:hypothetical protein GCM10008090_01150 [Arenicella chitinivorans]|uniref:Uncharacterized protein n=1 Tax=Arenicella chitinivorans TaxID=1329800 RepID=A0A918RHN2_9GAMM|nr:hypothetical protein [Arenicella chitinivorans]GGZ96685.1 hypothetical protein GCM10008090_01150 [Arenicella chitinivorans]